MKMPEAGATSEYGYSRLTIDDENGLVCLLCDDLTLVFMSGITKTLRRMYVI